MSLLLISFLQTGFLSLYPATPDLYSVHFNFTLGAIFSISLVQNKIIHIWIVQSDLYSFITWSFPLICVMSQTFSRTGELEVLNLLLLLAKHRIIICNDDSFVYLQIVVK